MANARKLPSGSWRVQVYAGMAKGRRHYESFTAATRREAERLAAEWATSKDARPEGMTVGKAIEKYIDLKEPQLSPSTIRGYVRYRDHYYDTINPVPLRKLSVEILQSWINERSAVLSAKTVRNAYGLLSAALQMFGAPSYRVQLPKEVRPELYTPTDADIKTLIRHTDGILLTAIMLAAFCSLRRGEVCALDMSDVEGNVLHVKHDMVADKSGTWIIKEPKTRSSIRDVTAPDFLIRRLPEEGRICPITPKQLTDRFRRAVSSAGIPHFRFHDLRHYYVSIAHAIGIPDAYIMESGGWSSPAVMNRVYKNTLSDFKKRESDRLNSHFSGIMQHEMQHAE